MLETLRKSNQEMKKVLESFRDPSMNSYLLEKKLLKEFNKLYNSYYSILFEENKDGISNLEEHKQTSTIDGDSQPL